MPEAALSYFISPFVKQPQLVRGGPDVKPTLSRAQTSENVDLILADFFGLKHNSFKRRPRRDYRKQGKSL
jgi:hypothetical protein